MVGSVFLLVLLPLIVCGDDRISEKVNGFSVNLLQEVLQERTGNVIMSPLSVSVLLAILHQGAAGNTKDQLTRTLQAEPKETQDIYNKIVTSLQNVTNGASLELANGAFLNRGYEVLPTFKTQLQKDFLSQIDVVDFAANTEAAQHINNWVSEHTHDKIKELLTPDMLSSLTRLVLVNAIYFKDLWSKPFIPESTITETFYAENERQVPMMHTQDDFKRGQFEDVPAKWLQLPFQGDRFSTLIVLPQERNGLQSLVPRLTGSHISNIVNNDQQSTEPVIVILPKFKLSTDLKLIPFLEKLNITDPFSVKADFSKLSREAIYVSEVVQKAVMEVDELGATAAAATGAVGVTYALHTQPPAVFRADHPFLVFIIDHLYNTILFAGRVSDPSQ